MLVNVPQSLVNTFLYGIMAPFLLAVVFWMVDMHSKGVLSVSGTFNFTVAKEETVACNCVCSIITTYLTNDGKNTSFNPGISTRNN